MRYELRSFFGAYPSVYLPVLRWLGRNNSRYISQDTQMVIEGFPRSGNTFSCAAFNYAQRQRTVTACHMHAPAQVIQAARLRIPTLVIVRRPKDAIVAWKMTHPRLGLRQLLRGYVRYHHFIRPYVEECTIATFAQVTKDLGAVIGRVNARFGTNFERFDHTKENAERVFRMLEDVAYQRLPDRKFIETIPDHLSHREMHRSALKVEFERLQSTRLFQRSQELYDYFESHANK